MFEAAASGDVSRDSTAYKTLMRFLRTDEQRTLKLLNLWVTGCTKASGAGQTSKEGVRPKLQRVVSALAKDSTLSDEVRETLRSLSGRLFGPTNETHRRIWPDEVALPSYVRNLTNQIGLALKQTDIGAIGRQIMRLHDAASPETWKEALSDPSVKQAVDRMSAYPIWSPKGSLSDQVIVVLYLKRSAQLPFSELTMRNLQNTFDKAVASNQRSESDADLVRARQRFATI